FRHQVRLSEAVNPVKQRFLPPTPETMDGLEHFVLATDRIAEDVAGKQALREWVERGGALWVLLDRVREETVAAVLQDVITVRVVDRVSLTRVHVRSGPAYQHRPDIPATDFEDPVDFVRVLVPGVEPQYTVDGWPAAFVKDVGRGRVFFTTLGPRGWMRDRVAGDPPSRFRDQPRLPVVTVPFEYLANDIHRYPERPPFAADELRGYVTERIGYSVISRGAVVAVFAALFLALIAAAVALDRMNRREHLGWIGPALAVGAAAAFFGLGGLSRRAVPPTVAVAQLVEAVPGLDEAQVSGHLAVYQPALSDVAVGAADGGTLDLDLAGLEGRVRRRVQTDLGRWHWENLELPAGVRLGTFQHTLRTPTPVAATVRFGPDGAEGRVTAGPFGRLEDVLVSSPGERTVAVGVAPDGTFSARTAGELQGAKLGAGGLLTDRQRARQRLVEKLLAEPRPRHLADRNLLLAWADPLGTGFTLAAEPRTTGDALLVVPVRFERTPPGTRVTVPPAFVHCQRVGTDGRLLVPPTESSVAADVRLRFQVPPSVLPLAVESARLTIKLNAPGREAVVGAGAVTLRRLPNPSGNEEIVIDDPSLLRPDEQGGLYVNVAIGEAARSATGRDVWHMGSLGLEIRGRTSEGKGEHEPK
ncbi:MAG: hypothetical protein ACRC33_20865, partial [Gemmataceae bacterium]